MNSTVGDFMENRIKKLRKEAGISQKKLGDELGVAQTTISAWESGRNEPDYDSIRKMAEILTTSPDYLMGYNSDDIPEDIKKLNIANDLKESLTLQNRRNRFNDDFPEELEDIDPEILQDAYEERESNINETWEKTGNTIYRESAEIDTIFEDRNLDQKSRQRAVEVINLMFPKE